MAESNSRNNRDRGKDRFKDRKHDSLRKEYDADSVRSNSTSKSSKQYDRKFEDRNAHHSSRHYDRRISHSSSRPNSKTRSSSPASQRYKQESIPKDYPSSSHNDAMLNGHQQRSSHDGDRYITDEPRFVPYNNHTSYDVNHNDALVASLKQHVDRLTNQVEFFFQENEKLKLDLRSVSNQAHDASSSEVNISFRDKNLERQFLPILEELVSELISQNIGVEDLQTFLFSKRNSAENYLPEGELFALDNSTSEPNESSHVPRYETSFSEILQDQDLMNQVDAKKDKPVIVKTCFNCSEDHMIQQCPYQMDYRKIAIARKQRSKTFVPQVRYHVQGMREMDAKPGTISDELREALILGPNQIPPFIYRMRVLDYPPGWLIEAVVETSGIALYGTDTKTDENQEGGEQNVGSRVQYDPDKLIDFPGFNVPLPPNFIDESELLCWPPLQDHHLRSVVEQHMPKVALPKRKRKLTLPDCQISKVPRLEEDMEVEETLENGSLEFNPPLPEETPPPPPPEDEPQPPLPEEEPSPPLPQDETKPLTNTEENYESNDSGTNTPMSASIMEALAPVVERFKMQNNKLNESTPSLKELEEIKKQLVMELGISEDSSSNGSTIILNESGSIIVLSDSEPSFSRENSNDASNCSLGSESQSTSRQLSKTESCSEAQASSRQISLTESQDSETEAQASLKEISIIEIQDSGSEAQTSSKEISIIEIQDSGSEAQVSSKEISFIENQDSGFEAEASLKEISMIENQDSGSEAQTSSKEFSFIESQDSGSEAQVSSKEISMIEIQARGTEAQTSSRQLSRTDSQRSGSTLVSLGTPSLSRHSSFHKLPDYDNFSKNVTNHLNFENLPNSVGTYQKMKKVIKKVKEKINAFMQ